MTDRETIEATLKDYLSKQMPAGTEIGDPLWWAANIAKVVATALAQPEQSQTSGYAKKIESLIKERDELRQQLAQPEQEPVCDKDPFYCWSIRCQVGKVCKHTAQPEQSKYSDIVSDGGLDPRNKFDAQPKQEPVAWCSLNGRGEIGYFDGKPMIMVGGISNEHHETPLYTAPAKREWVSLSDIEIKKIVDLNTSDDGGFDIWCDGIAVAHIVCAKLKEKNA